MPFNPYDKYQTPILGKCPQCKQPVSFTCNYCSNCGASLRQTIPNYVDPTKIKLDPRYIDPIKVVPDPLYRDPSKIKLDPSIMDYTNPAKVTMPAGFCSQCGQRINRPQPDEICNPYNLNSYSSSNNGTCFIATACNADSETLGTFYKFRDEILLRSSIGKQAVQLYYRFSPGVAKHIKKSKMLQSSILSVLLKPLAVLLRFSVLGSKDAD